MALGMRDAVAVRQNSRRVNQRLISAVEFVVFVVEEPEFVVVVGLGFAKDAEILAGGVIPMLRMRSRRASITATWITTSGLALSMSSIIFPRE